MPLSQTPLPELRFPESLNYVGVFLTFACNLNCSYCINDPEQEGKRRERFPKGEAEMPPEYWRAAFARFPISDDLPITLQGGEPTLYGRGKGLGEIVANSDLSFDLLTNLTLPTQVLDGVFLGQQKRFMRAAPYPSVRVSFHADEMNRCWKGNGIETLVDRCEAMRELGFTVTADKSTSDVGIYIVDHPENQAVIDRAMAAAKGRVPIETKEFLGVHQGKLHGTYLYPHSTSLIETGLMSEPLSCECRTTELLIDPLGFVWRCHFFLYESWIQSSLIPAFKALEAVNFAFTANLDVLADLPFQPIGHILDPEFTMDALRVFRPCDSYGQCIGCDTKVKNDRHQSLYDFNQPHTSVEIRNIEMPTPLVEATVPAEIAENLMRQGVLRTTAVPTQDKENRQRQHVNSG